MINPPRLGDKSKLTADKLFDGVKHSDVPDLEDIRKGQVDVDGIEVGPKSQTGVTVKKADDYVEGQSS
jgi:hypothetical protein